MLNPDVDTADTINAALGKGYNLLLQPGIYKLDKAIEVTHENTIVLGLGMATFTSSDKNTDTFIRVAGKKWNSDYTKVEENYDIGGVENRRRNFRCRKTYKHIIRSRI